MPNYPPSSPLTLPEPDMLTFARLDQHRMRPERGAVGNLAEHTIASLAWRS